MRRDRLRKRRDELGLTQQELADATNISIAQIQRYDDEPDFWQRVFLMAIILLIMLIGQLHRAP